MIGNYREVIAADAAAVEMLLDDQVEFAFAQGFERFRSLFGFNFEIGRVKRTRSLAHECRS